jgi:hypothetical protein
MFPDFRFGKPNILGVFQIVNKRDTSRSAYKSFDFSYVGGSMYKNRRGHEAATNRGE